MNQPEKNLSQSNHHRWHGSCQFDVQNQSNANMQRLCPGIHWKSEHHFCKLRSSEDVFEKCINSSLKDKMRQKRTKEKSAHYRVTDSTLIQSITFTLKNFLTNNKTKADLTKYLAVKCLAYNNLLSANWRTTLWHQEQRPRATQVFEMFYSHTAKKRRALSWSCMLSRWTKTQN